MLDYNDNKQSMNLKRCDPFTEILDWNTGLCVNCLMKASFVLRKPMCQRGPTSWFFD